MISKRNKLISGILGISLSVMMLGIPVFAATASYNVASGNGAVYSIGSKQDFTIEVDAPYDKLVSVTLDGNVFTDYMLSGTSAPAPAGTTSSSQSQSSDQSTTVTPSATTETPTTTETPAATTEAPAATTEAPAATTEAPAATTEAPAATTEAPAATTEAPAATSEAPEPSWSSPATSESPYVTPAPTPMPTPSASEGPAVTPGPSEGLFSIAMENTYDSAAVSLYSVLKSIWSPVSVQAADTGKTILTIKGERMDTLSEGAHKLVLTYTDGAAEINFTVQNAAQIDSPKTGDRAGVFGFSILAFVSGITLLVLAKKNTAK